MARKKKQAVLVIDMLNDFVKKGAPLEVPAAKGIVREIKSVIGKARSEGTPVIFLCDSHKKDDPEFKMWPPHAVKGSKGARVVEELEPWEDDHVIPKTTYSGFYGTKLESILKSLGVTDLIITGVATNICVLYTAADAYMRGFSVTIPDGCTAALSEEDRVFALRQIRDVLKLRVRAR